MDCGYNFTKYQLQVHMLTFHTENVQSESLITAKCDDNQTKHADEVEKVVPKAELNTSPDIPQSDSVTTLEDNNEVLTINVSNDHDPSQSAISICGRNITEKVGKTSIIASVKLNSVKCPTCSKMVLLSCLNQHRLTCKDSNIATCLMELSPDFADVFETTDAKTEYTDSDLPTAENTEVTEQPTLPEIIVKAEKTLTLDITDKSTSSKVQRLIRPVFHVGTAIL